MVKRVQILACIHGDHSHLVRVGVQACTKLIGFANKAIVGPINNRQVCAVAVIMFFINMQAKSTWFMLEQRAQWAICLYLNMKAYKEKKSCGVDIKNH